ncbi:hypothetical protein FRC12_019850 [Ceratobasidium sp. 428]|nr:hypothetical protein FRC12_019850 [Ceratobasidium sp. 428]
MLFSHIIALVAVSAVTVAALPSPDNGTVSKPCDKHPRAVGEPVDAGIERRHDLAARRKGINPDLSSLPRHGHKARDTPAKDPLDDATKNLQALRPKVADAMAGPKEERETKLLAITVNVLDILKPCYEAIKANASQYKLSDPKIADEMDKMSKAMIRVVRSCKGQHSAEIAKNIGSIRYISIGLVLRRDPLLTPSVSNSDMMGAIEKAMGENVDSKLVGSAPTTWAINTGKLSIIQAGLTA